MIWLIPTTRKKTEGKKIAEQPKDKLSPLEKKISLNKEETKGDKEEAKENKDKKEKPTSKKPTKEKKAKKTEAVVHGKDLPLSKKHCIAICDMIRGKRIEKAILMLEEVIKMKKAVPMKGEIPHRKGKIMSGRYPINATKSFIKLLRQLSANATNNEMEIENGIIECKADRAARPYKRFGSMRFKRTHLTLRLVIKDKKKSKLKNKKK